ncbi:Josephin-domain-containing protein [Russula dissimulans]|nr:Josephin-domain-containing protein [Russula dissimulans]
MDDTGFFSIHVLENALNVWGQSLIRWRSEAMRPYQNRPQEQRAFILNCDQHWFTLRKFGDPNGVGHWFNLNSSRDRPEWVGETYLGILLRQAEADGYSTFVVVPTDSDHPLPQTEADVIAASLSQSASSGAQYSSTSRSPPSAAGLEDEDLQLQAALQASLDNEPPGVPSFPIPRIHPGPFGGGPSVLLPRATTSVPSPYQPTSPPPPIPPPSTRPVDQPMTNPVAASMARNQAVLERMRREQEAALREHYNEEASRLDDPVDRSYGIGNHVEDEEEQLRRAIEASREMARERELLGGVAGSDAAETRLRTEDTQAEPWARERVQGGRVYDDEDEALQAALQASLETAPPGIHTPNSNFMPPRSRRSPLPTASTSGPRDRSFTSTDEREEEDDEMYDDDDDDEEEEDKTATEETLSDTADSDSQPAPPAENVDLEEMRRRRLARFGG